MVILYRKKARKSPSFDALVKIGLVVVTMNLKLSIFYRMVSHRRPEEGPRSSVILQYRKAIPYEGRTIFKAKEIDISRFRNYGELELYLVRKSGGGHRIYPGGADYPVITYTKYQEDDNERQLRTEPWRRFAASVSYILIERKKS